VSTRAPLVVVVVLVLVGCGSANPSAATTDGSVVHGMNCGEAPLPATDSGIDSTVTVNAEHRIVVTLTNTTAESRNLVFDLPIMRAVDDRGRIVTSGIISGGYQSTVLAPGGQYTLTMGAAAVGRCGTEPNLEPLAAGTYPYVMEFGVEAGVFATDAIALTVDGDGHLSYQGTPIEAILT
jgi:hypothetical protein